MTTLIWTGVFIISLLALIKGADFLLESAEKIGKYFKLPPFVIGALIVGIGTSLPELASSIAAVFGDQSEIVVSNAVGSNIANILLVAGLSAVVGFKLSTKDGKKNKLFKTMVRNKIVSTKDLINLEAPLLVLSTVLFLGVAYDGVINKLESVLVAFSFLIYLSYLVFHEDDSEDEISNKETQEVKKIVLKDYLYLAGGGVVLALGANYLIESIVKLSEIWNVNPELISVSVVAVGTSLPEIFVSIGAVKRGNADMAFGNVFGSNVFNMLMIVGVVGLFSELPLDEKTLTIALPFLAITTLIFTISVLTKRIYVWEGLMFLMIYVLFLFKIFGLA